MGTKKSRRSSRKSRLSVYDNPTEQSERIQATNALGWSTRRRAFVLLVVMFFTACVGGLIWHFRPDDGAGNMGSSEPMTGRRPRDDRLPINGLVLNKGKNCYQDTDCPDKAYCGHAGYCVPSEMEPEQREEPVLGRGRGGEGANVYRSSLNQRGQN